MRHWRRIALTRLCLLLWGAVILADILRAAWDAFEDRTTAGLPGCLSASALAITMCAMIRAATAQADMRRHRRDLRIMTVALWLMEAATLAERNTGGSHPASYLLGYIFATGLAAATGTICLVIRAAGGRDKARLIRALASTSERDADQLQHHLVVAPSASLPEDR